MSTRQPRVSSLGDEAVDVRRYVDVLRRNARLIAAIVVLVTAVVLAVSSAFPKSYKASARLVYNPTLSVLAPTDAESTQRQLATYQSLVQAPTVIAAAARRLHEPTAAVREATSSSVESSANILSISATAPRPSLAAARSNAVAHAFLNDEEAMQNSGFQDARNQLEAEITRLKGSPNASAQIAALESRISALQISATGTESELQIAESATAPTSATSPRVAVNGLIALVASLIVAILIVLARNQLRPRFASPRELGDALDLPVLAGIPYRRRLTTPRRRLALSGLEREAYDLLQTAVRLLGLPAGGQRILLVTSATHAEGKTTVTANLGRSLARIGAKTLLISGDMRSPTLHEQFDLPSSPGLSECLRTAQTDQSALGDAIDAAIRPAPDELNLDIMAAGRTPSHPTSLVSSPALGTVVEALSERDYTYVLIDSPPLLGISDAQLLARQADDLLLVGRLDRVSPYQVEELQGLLARLELAPVGLTVVGARAEFSPYYINAAVVATRSLTP
jgi:capsular exopolysaccharide synthesis family protein